MDHGKTMGELRPTGKAKQRHTRPHTMLIGQFVQYSDQCVVGSLSTPMASQSLEVPESGLVE
jgi:hypothetical protein